MTDGQDERELPTIQEIESLIWEIARSNASPVRLEACRLLLERIEARGKGGLLLKDMLEFAAAREAEDAKKDPGE